MTLALTWTAPSNLPCIQGPQDLLEFYLSLSGLLAVAAAASETSLAHAGLVLVSTLKSVATIRTYLTDAMAIAPRGLWYSAGGHQADAGITLLATVIFPGPDDPFDHRVPTHAVARGDGDPIPWPYSIVLIVLNSGTPAAFPEHGRGCLVDCRT